MKVAYHFNAGHPAYGSCYGLAVEKILWPIVLAVGAQRLNTKIYVGDIPLVMLDPEERSQFWKRWIVQSQNGWRRFTKRIEGVADMDVFVVCFDTLNRHFARDLHKRLAAEEGYLGAVEIDDTSKLHWHFYSDALRLEYRIIDTAISVFFDCLEVEGPTLEEKDEAFKLYRGLGFKSVGFEGRNGRHTIFDTYHDWQHARRVADWRNRFGDQLAMIADDVAARLGDVAPDLPDRLWTAMDTFERAETNEHYANVCHSCRRIIEYVADMLFPPTTDTRNGRKLGENNFRNRLMAFVEDQGSASQTIDVVCSSMELFASHVEKLQDLANKGVHSSNITKEAARRCLLRVVFLLDDIISLKPEAFPIRTVLDTSLLDGGISSDGPSSKDEQG